MWCGGGANLFVARVVNISRSIGNNLKPVLEHPVCTCGAHMVWSRVRLSMLNDPQRNTLLLKALGQVGPPPQADRLVGSSKKNRPATQEGMNCVLNNSIGFKVRVRVV